MNDRLVDSKSSAVDSDVYDYHSLRPYIQREGEKMDLETTSAYSCIQKLDEESIHNFLESNNCRLIVRPHWITRPYQYSSDRIETISHAEEPDLYNLFSVSDILVTDYSSAFIDWLILRQASNLHTV